jgi:hypothetical protein
VNIATHQFSKENSKILWEKKENLKRKKIHINQFTESSDQQEK